METATPVFRPQVEVEPALQPRYAESFRCIGSACEDTCCRGWTVKVDEGTYARYEALPAGPLADRLRASLVQITVGQTSANFANIQMDATGSCPLLDAERMCSVQKEHGPELLSQVCTQYPRAKKTVQQREEQTLLLSCPEAARLVLLDPQLIPDLHAPGLHALGQDARYGAFLLPASVPAADNLDSYFPAIRHLTLQLLTDAAYPIWQRLFLLGAFSRRLEAVVAGRRLHRVPDLMAEYAVVAETGGLALLMGQVPAQPVLQLTLVLQLLGERARIGGLSARFEGFLGRFTQGLGYRAGSTAESLAPAYVRACAAVYTPWVKSHPLVLQNYLVNSVLASLFPVGVPGPEQGRRPVFEYQRLAIHFGLIQGLLIGIAADDPARFNTDDVIGLVQTFTKTIEVYPGFIDRALTMMELAGLDPAQAVTALMRDPAAQSG